MSTAWLPGDTRQRIQDLTKSNNITQAECVPDNADAVTQLASDLRDIRMPVINADTTAIQNLFMLIVRDIKSQGEAIAADSNAVTAEVLQRLREELSKGQDSLDLRKITAEGLTAAVMRAISIADISEETLHGLGSAYKKVLDEMREAIHDE